ncbi:MAG: hypothetical protein WD512_18515 [Candidatus Paceibacterota bacterium]
MKINESELKILLYLEKVKPELKTIQSMTKVLKYNYYYFCNILRVLHSKGMIIKLVGNKIRRSTAYELSAKGRKFRNR